MARMGTVSRDIWKADRIFVHGRGVGASARWKLLPAAPKLPDGAANLVCRTGPGRIACGSPTPHPGQ